MFEPYKLFKFCPVDIVDQNNVQICQNNVIIPHHIVLHPPAKWSKLDLWWQQSEEMNRCARNINLTNYVFNNKPLIDENEKHNQVDKSVFISFVLVVKKRAHFKYCD